MSSKLTSDRGAQLAPKISTRDLIREVANHTKVPYKEVSDVVYAFLHYVKYAVLATEQRIVIRNFGTFYPAIVKGREYGKHVDASTYHPDRIKLALTSPLIEVERWKNTQSIQSQVATALAAELKPASMDLSVCVRIADLVLSNKPLKTLTGENRIRHLRDWVYATGASPLIPAVDSRLDSEDKPYNILKFRIRGGDRRLLVFDHEPELFYVSALLGSKRDVVFLPDGWVSAKKIMDTVSDLSSKDKTIEVVPYGNSAEEEALSLFQAYQAVKYGG